MKRVLPKPAVYLASLKELQVADAALPALVTSVVEPLPPSVVDWLAKLTLLYGVPFEHLVSNSALLPAESLRFFYLDPNWINCLIDGAMSIGMQNSRDVEITRAAYYDLRRLVGVQRTQVRRKLAGAPALELTEIDTAVSGLLMRSQLVSGWPGLTVVAYESYTTGPNKNIIPGPVIQTLRMDRLAPDTLLCLFAKTPALVQLSEPKEGIEFGLRSNNTIVPRFLGYHPDQPVGQFVTGDPTPSDEAKLVTRPASNVLDVLATRDNITAILKNFNALQNPGDTLTAAEFGIELIKSPEQQSFINGPVDNPNPNDCTNY